MGLYHVIRDGRNDEKEPYIWRYTERERERERERRRTAASGAGVGGRKRCPTLRKKIREGQPPTA